jgi:hypothetical protein
MMFFKIYPFQENVNFEYVASSNTTDEFNVYLLLFLLKNPSYKRKAGTARTSRYSPLTIHCYYILSLSRLSHLNLRRCKYKIDKCKFLAG